MYVGMHIKSLVVMHCSKQTGKRRKTLVEHHIRHSPPKKVWCKSRCPMHADRKTDGQTRITQVFRYHISRKFTWLLFSMFLRLSQ